MKLYKFLRAIVRPFVRLFYRVRIIGRENEPKTPYIVCANHSSAMDPIILLCSLKQPLHFIAKHELVKNRLLAYLYGKVGMIIVNRNGRDVSALRDMCKVIENGGSVGIFPQGRRIHSAPKPEQAIAGFAVVAMQTKADVLPVSIVADGGPKIFRKTKIVIHPPISYDEYMSCKDEPMRNDVAAYCFGRVCSEFEVE